MDKLPLIVNYLERYYPDKRVIVERGPRNNYFVTLGNVRYEINETRVSLGPEFWHPTETNLL